MKLNMHIIYDEMSRYKPEFVCKDTDIALNLKAVKLITDTDAYKEDELYVAEYQNVNIGRLRAGLHLVILGALSCVPICNNVKVIYLPEEKSALSVLAFLQSVFIKYMQWDLRLKEAVIRNEAIDQIMQMGAEFLLNPICLDDVNGYSIAYAGQIPHDVAGTPLERILERGHLNLEEYGESVLNEIDKIMEKADRPIIYPSVAPKGEHKHIIAKLYRNGKVFAQLGSPDVNCPHSLGQLSIVYQLKKIIESFTAFNSQLFNYGKYNHVITKILEREYQKPDVIDFLLKSVKWSKNDKYHMITLNNINDAVNPENMYNNYSKRLSDILWDCIVVSYNKDLLVISHGAKNEVLRENIMEKLESLLITINMKAGISMDYYDFEEMHIAYKQCKAALSVGVERAANQYLYHFEKYYLSHIATFFRRHDLAETLCHPAVRKLLRNPGPKNSELLYTLFVYLNNGKNVSATARELFIHRSTLLYRVEILSDMLETDIQNIDYNTAMILNLSCMIAEYNQNGIL